MEPRVEIIILFILSVLWLGTWNQQTLFERPSTQPTFPLSPQHSAPGRCKFLGFISDRRPLTTLMLGTRNL